MKFLRKIISKGIPKALDKFLEFMSLPATQRTFMFIAFIVCGVVSIWAQSPNAGISTAASNIKEYKEQVRSLMNAIGAVIAIVGAFNIFFKMQNGDQDVKKTIMLTIGGCVAFVALGNALPMFFEN